MGTARAVAPGIFPLDKELGLIAGSPWSNRARELIVRVGTEVPFERGPGLLALLTDLQVSVSTVRAVTEAAGSALVAVEAAEHEHLLRTLPAAPEGAPVQQVSVDGAMVPLVGGVWREVRTLAVGAIAPTARGERHTTALSYRSRLTEATAFADAALGELHRRGTEHAAVVAAVADGAGWCQQFFDEQIPGSIRILDFPHAVEHLSMVAQAVFGSGTEATSEWLGRQRHELRTGDPAAVLAAITALPVGSASDPAEAARVRDRELAYFSTRRTQIAYADFGAAGLPIGSGAVESANKLVVEARLKGAGMHWAAGQVDPMLALRCALCSHRWDETWTAITTHLSTVATSRPTPRPPATPTPSHDDTPVPPSAPPRREPTIVNGRPTKDHPWKRGLARRTQVTTTTNC
jgi:hypothetical protein